MKGKYIIIVSIYEINVYIIIISNYEMTCLQNNTQ